ncbi:MAG: site-specific DNA-methyltransferase [Schaalia turicensis]|nr:site-specific DNA-methyltransferase [Schaalia turicensis]
MTAQRLQLTWYNKDKALIPTETGKYGYTWVDPSDPRYCETHTLVLDDYVQGSQTPKSDEFAYSERADLEPQDDNLLILGESGDVLEALTRVPELAEKYVGQVKLIYIDPPFNTAQTFASYEDNLEHSIWLTMMRDRLLHMKKLLADDGSIWVHLDDAEVHRMRVLMDEVFGAGNFLAEVAWEKVYSPRGDAKEFSKRIDTILVYRAGDKFSLNAIEKPANLAQFRLVDEDGRHYRSDPLRKWGKNSRREDRPNLWYPICSPHGEEVWPVKPDGTQGNWRWKKEKVQADYSKIDWLDKGNGIQPYLRQYAESSNTRPPETLWASMEAGHSQEGKEEIKALFPKLVPFSTPKPERLLERIIHIGSNPGDIVLDVFAGSGTTAAVAQKMGRRWVTCELLESTFTTFTRPRLEKVVGDQDPGGITRTKGERVDATEDGLPDGVSPEDAAKFASVLNKLIKDDPELKKSVEVKSLKAASKTRRTKEVINWRGGGGFQVAHLSPACFDYDPALDRVMLTAAATGETLIESVAANLGFTLLHPDDDYIFDARRGNALLKVVEGVATTEIVDWLASQVQPGETIVLAATTVMDGVRQHLRKLVKGSRVVALPDDVFRYAEGGDQ